MYLSTRATWYETRDDPVTILLAYQKGEFYPFFILFSASSKAIPISPLLGEGGNGVAKCLEIDACRCFGGKLTF